MVIACPNCQRKYQIDTSRIPTSGTSFTCWSCRATVRVDPIGNATAQHAEAAESDASTGLTPATPPTTAESSIPLSAMRFFESLAGEASMNQKMADQSGRAESPHADSSTLEVAAPPPPSDSHTAPPPTAVRSQTIDLMTGDDVLDLPPVIPANRPPVETGRVLDIPVADLATSPFGDVRDDGPSADTTAEMASPAANLTKVLASESAEPPSPPLFEIEAAPSLPELAQTGPPPRPRITPTPIPLPAQITQPTVPVEPVRFRGARSVTPSPTSNGDAGMADAGPVVDPEPSPDVASVSPFFEPPRTVPAPSRMTPAEMAVSQPTAWVAPGVTAERPAPKRNLGWLAFGALVVVALCAALAWRMGLRDFFVHKTAAPRATEHPASPPPVQAPAQTKEPPETTAPSPSAPASKVETAESPSPAVRAPVGDGNFTIQVRSSPNEADAKSAADALKAAGVDAYVVRADLGSRGVWYRLRVGRYATREEASQAASKLRSSGRAGETIVQDYQAP